MLGATIGWALVNSSSILRAASRFIIPLTLSIALSSSRPQTGHMWQRKLQRVAKSMRSRSGMSGTGSGFQSYFGSTHSALDQSRIDYPPFKRLKSQTISDIGCPAPLPGSYNRLGRNDKRFRGEYWRLSPAGLSATGG